MIALREKNRCDSFLECVFHFLKNSHNEIILARKNYNCSQLFIEAISGIKFAHKLTNFRLFQLMRVIIQADY